jgi:hypothetical protein
MRRWGIVISLAYVVIVVALLGPAFMILIDDKSALSANFFSTVLPLYKEWGFWLFVAVLALCQILLLFLSVDVSHKRLKPRTHIAITCVVTVTLITVLAVAAITSFGAALSSKTLDDMLFNSAARELTILGAIWAGWAVIFYLFFRNSSSATAKAISWLIKGSVLELLIAIPCHVIVRRRDECCATIPTGFGISTGIAIMLLSFGPSVLFLYRKRLDGYSVRSTH